MPERDVHEGLADLEQDLDVGELLRGDAPGSDPLRDAAAEFRRGEDDDLSGFDLVDDEPSGDKPPGKTDDQGKEKEAEGDAGEAALEGEEEQEGAEEKEGEGEETEGEEKKDEQGEDEGAEPDKTKLKGFTLEIPPLAPGVGRGREQQSIVLEGLPQEFHDLIKGHIGRSQRLGVAEQQLVAAQEYQVAAEFVDQQPLAAMLMLDQNDTKLAQPRAVGEKFVTLWLRQHPEQAIKLVEKLGYHNASSLDPEILKERAEASRDRAEMAVRKGLESQRGRTQGSQWANHVSGMLDGLANEMQLSVQDKEDFMELAVAQIRQRSDALKHRGGNPLLTRADVLKTIERTVQRFSPNGGRAPARTTRDPKEKFDQRHRVQRRTRATAGGESALTPSVTIQAKKFQGAKSVKEAAARLRKGS